MHAHQAVGDEQRQLLDDPLSLGQHQRCGDLGPFARVFEQTRRHVVDAVAADFRA